MAKKVKRSNRRASRTNYRSVMRETKSAMTRGQKFVKAAGKSSNKALKAMAASTQRLLDNTYAEMDQLYTLYVQDAKNRLLRGKPAPKRVSKRAPKRRKKRR
jgi:hypothetical protein